MALTLTQLETFLRVATLGNFTRVAEELHLTQPGVTQQVRALERHFGVRLVDVVGRRPLLTDAGHFLAVRAPDLLASVAALSREMGEFATARAGELCLGATFTIGSYVLPDLLARFARAYPSVRMRVEIANTPTITERIEAGALSVALVEGPMSATTLQAEPFQPDLLWLITAPGHRFAASSHIQAAELAGEPFVWREQGSGTRAIVETVLAEAGVHPPVALELPNSEGVARAVEAGLGVAVLSHLVVERAVAAGRLTRVEIDDLDLRRTFRLVRMRGRTLSPAARAFAQLLHSQTNDPGADGLVDGRRAP